MRAKEPNKDSFEVPWHPSQQHIARPNDAVEITLRLNNLIEVKHDILKWGEHAEVIAPLALRTAVRESLLAAAKLYQDDQNGVKRGAAKGSEGTQR